MKWNETKILLAMIAVPLIIDDFFGSIQTMLVHQTRFWSHTTYLKKIRIFRLLIIC